MADHDIIAIGGSAGGIEGLQELVRGLPADLGAAIFVAIHVSVDSPGVLPQLLSKAGRLPASYGRHGEAIEKGRIYVAPPNYHMTLEDSSIRLGKGPKENGFRPAVDPLFRTASRAYGPRVVGVILSGGLNDGTAGLMAIKRRGGKAVVQDPKTTMHSGMPSSAIHHVKVDYVAKLAEMPAILTELAGVNGCNGEQTMRQGKRHGPDVSEAGDLASLQRLPSGPPSGFVCPECGGALWELTDGKLVLYRCHVGHSFTGDGLVAQHGEVVESALWTALRVLEENAALNRRIAQRLSERMAHIVAKAFEQRAADAEERAAAIRAVLLNEMPPLSKKAKQELRDQPESSLTRKVTGRRKGRDKDKAGRDKG